MRFTAGTLIEIDEFLSFFELAMAGIQPQSMENTKVTVRYRILDSSFLWRWFNPGKVRLQSVSIEPKPCSSMVPLSVLPIDYIEMKMKLGLGKIVQDQPK